MSSSRLRAPTSIFSALLMSLPATVACTRTPEAPKCERSSRVLSADLPVDAFSPVMSNGLTSSNMMSTNGHGFPELIEEALNSASIADGNIHDVLQEIGAQTVMRYLVECALPETSSVALALDDGGTVTYMGALGLAPEWASGPCNLDCQQWVSACMIARVNLWGMPYAIYLTGDNPNFGMTTPGDMQDYPFQEGAFYGNYFTDPIQSFACPGKDFDPFAMTIRACTYGSRCGFTRPGSCGFRDGRLGTTSDRRVCEQEVDGSYVNCHDQPSDPGGATFPAGSRSYKAITIYLRDTRFSDADSNGGGC